MGFLIFFYEIPSNRYRKDKVTKPWGIFIQFKVDGLGVNNINLNGKVMSLDSRLSEVIHLENEVKYVIASTNTNS